MNMSVEMKDVVEDKGSGKPVKPELQILYFITMQEFESWLEQNNTLASGIWIRFYKKNSGMPTILYGEALDAALCYGWIDGQVKKYDTDSYLQKFTPRRIKSIWSKRNVDHVTRLEKEGRMRPAGIKAVEDAKTDGRWEKAYDSPGNMEVPEDFMQELSKNKKALGFFESLNKANKYSIGWRFQTAKNPEARAKRMAEILDMMEKEKKFH